MIADAVRTISAIRPLQGFAAAGVLAYHAKSLGDPRFQRALKVSEVLRGARKELEAKTHRARERFCLTPVADSKVRRFAARSSRAACSMARRQEGD